MEDSDIRRGNLVERVKPYLPRPSKSKLDTAVSWIRKLSPSFVTSRLYVPLKYSNSSRRARREHASSPHCRCSRRKYPATFPTLLISFQRRVARLCSRNFKATAGPKRSETLSREKAGSREDTGRNVFKFYGIEYQTFAMLFRRIDRGRL